MSFVKKVSVTLTTAAGGAITGYSEIVTGKIAQIIYVKSTYANGVDFAITNETTGESIWTEADVNASKIVKPRVSWSTAVGVDGATQAGNTHFVVANDRIRFAITAGGDGTVGTFWVYLE